MASTLSYDRHRHVTNPVMTPVPESFRQALADLHDSAFRWALVCCGFDRDRAQEVMQMVYLEVLSGRAAFHGRSSLRTWLFAVVRNTALRLVAGSRRAEAGAERLAHLTPEANGTDVCAQAMIRNQTRRAIVGALQGLSSHQRQMVELVYYHDLSVADAAAVMGISLGAARQHFHRAKRTLAAALRPLKEALGEE